MPNHVTTRCIVSGPAKDVAAFRARMFTTADDGKIAFDFRRIIPQPPALFLDNEGGLVEIATALIILRGTGAPPSATGGLYDHQIKSVRDEVGMPDAPMVNVATAWLGKHSEEAAAGLARLRSIVETGYASWYQCNTANWGTKWNAYAFRLVTEQPLEFVFETAWRFPRPVFDRLALEFPRLEFHCATFDEGWNFAGIGCFNPGPGSEAFAMVKPDDALYARVYGHAPDCEDPGEQESPEG